MYSKAQIGGHPLHPMVVAFPIAGFVGTLVGFAVFAANGGIFWLNLAIALAVAGAGMGLVAALPGFVDWAFGIPRTSRAKVVGLAHMLLNVSSVGLIAAAAGEYFPNWNGPKPDAALGLGLSSAAVLLTLAAGSLGWMLVQTYHVGIRLTADQAREEPAVQSLPVVPLHRHKAA
jgi:uncharacterized membrane protein